jgi:hypothetical protein
MTYRAAIRLKAKQPSTFIEEEITYKVFVTPENLEDLTKYLTEIRGFYSLLTDKVAKAYSKNRQFVLHGLSYNNKGPSILYRTLS